MKEKLSMKETLLVGSLLFGLFFGAGNLIFPVLLGQMAGSNVLLASVGFLITGVGLPILAIMAAAQSNSASLYEMAKPIGKPYAIFFTCALYLTIGPAFAIPRTATVAFEIGIRPFIGAAFLQSGLFIFSLIFFLVTLYFSLKPGRILDWIGAYLTPSFLVSLLVLILVTLIKPMGSFTALPPQGSYQDSALFNGLFEGYNTMDALAGLAFAIVIIKNIKDLGVRKAERITIEAGKSGLVSIVLMSLIYLALAYMGATSLAVMGPADNGGTILSLVSEYYFGFFGQILLAVIVILACLKTAIGLITACAGMFSELFPRSISYNKYAILFTLISLLAANLGLNNLIQYSIPVLMFLYPLAISLMILGLANPIIGKQKDIYGWTTVFVFVTALFDLAKALPAFMQDYTLIQLMVNFAENYIPWFNYGFGWVLPGLLGALIASVIWLKGEKSFVN